MLLVGAMLGLAPAFLEQLGAARGAGGETIWSVHLEHMEVLRVGLSPDGGRYETVRANA